MGINLVIESIIVFILGSAMLVFAAAMILKIIDEIKSR